MKTGTEWRKHTEEGDIMNYCDNLRLYLEGALELGKDVEGLDETLTRLKSALDRNYDAEPTFFSAIEGILHDGFKETYAELDKKKNPEKSFLQKMRIKRTEVTVDSLMPEMTKLIYLAPLMLETIASSQKYNNNKGYEGITTAGEIVFIENEYPSLLQEVKKLKESGATFDVDLILKIDSLYREETIDWFHCKTRKEVESLRRKLRTGKEELSHEAYDCV